MSANLRSPLGTIRDTEICGDTHLNSPLSNTMLKEALEVLSSQLPPRNNHVSENVAHLRQLLDATQLSPSFPFSYDPQCLLMPLSLSIPNCDPEGEWKKGFFRLWSLTSQYCPVSLTQFLPDVPPTELANKIKSVIHDPNNSYLIRYQWFSDMLIQGIHLSARPTAYKSASHLKITPGWIQDKDKAGLFFCDLTPYYIPLKIWLNSKYVIIQFESDFFLSTRLHYLMLSDVFEQRTAGLLCTELAKRFERSNYPSPSHLLEVFKIGDSLLERYKNEGYRSVALWEALVIGSVLSSQSDPVVESSSFLIKMVKEFVKSQGTTQVEVLTKFWKEEISPLLNDTPHHQLFELFGLHRIWGHPTICELAGIRKLKSIACRPRALDFHLIETISYKFRETFCLSYWRKNKTWPKMLIDPEAPKSALLSALREGRSITPHHPAYKMSDWKYITFLKNFSVPAKFELSELISDKATSFPISKLSASCKNSKTIGSSKERNVIMQWLQTDLNDPVALCDKINNEGFNPDEKCTGVHEKECEMKLEARFFGLLPLEKRLYVVLTEAMIANNLLEYFPDITMCFDSATLLQRIYTNTQHQTGTPNPQRGAGEEQDHAVVVNLDFNKWNSFMREGETYPIFKDMDNLFGYDNLISRTHEMFTSSTMYLADGTITPITDRGAWINDERVWTGHLGGIEGLRQKGWTIFTVTILKYVCDQAGLRCSLMGQGDNQVLILYYKQRDKEQWREIHSRFVEYLDTMVRHIGPPLKIEETWSSSNLFIYGKFPVWNGRPMSMALKRLVKLSTTTNDGLQSLASACSSIAANCSAASGADFDPIIPFIFGTYMTMKAVKLHITAPFFASEGHNTKENFNFKVPKEKVSQWVRGKFLSSEIREINRFSDRVLLGMIMIPSVLGGYPSLQFCDLASHGFPDPLSLNIYNLRHSYRVAKVYWPALCSIITNILSPQASNPPSYRMIMDDPVSINILRPSSEKDKLKMMVMKFLSQMKVKNTMFTSFLKIAELSQDILVESLSSTERLNPRICNSFLKATQIGRAMAVVGKIDKTRTMTGCMLQADKQKRIDIIREADDDITFELKAHVSVPVLFARFARNYTNSVIYHLHRTRQSSISVDTIECSTEYAQKLRNETWNKTIEGVTVAPPQEIFSLFPSSGLSCLSAGHPCTEAGKIVVILDTASDPTFNHLNDPLEMPLGPFRPYFGTRTQTKVKWEGNELKAVAPPAISGALDILCIPGWGVDKDSNFANLIYALVESYTDLNPRDLTPHNTEVSGSIVHRFQDQRTSHRITPSILWNYNTHINIITNDYTPENLPGNQGFKNFNFAFQSVFSWVASYISSQYINRTGVGYKSLHAHTCCPKCVKPVPEDLLEIDPCPDAINFLQKMRDPNNPYLYVSQEAIREDIVIRPKFLYINKQGVPQQHVSHLLSTSLVSRYLEEMGTQVIEGENRIRIAEKQFMVPVSASKILNQEEFFRNLAFIYILSFVHGRSLSLQIEGRTTIRSLLFEALGSCHQQDPIWFKGLLPLLLNTQEYHRLRKQKPDLLLPKGTPPSERAKCTYFHIIMKHFSEEMISGGQFQSYLDSFLSHPPIQSPLMCLHPLFLINVKRGLAREKDETYLGIKSIRNFRKMECARERDGRLDSLVDLGPILESVKDELDYQGILDQHDRDMRWYTSHHPEGYTSHVDYLIKEMEMQGCYYPFIECSLPSDNSIPLAKIQKLSPASTVIFSICMTDDNVYHAIPYNQDYVTLTLPETNLYNHLLKIGAPGTSAPFKLLSILQNLYVVEDKTLPSGRLSGTILGAGDGIGGFTATLGRVYPLSNLVLYTLFNPSLLNSVGIDRFVPAALGFHQELFSRVKNLDVLLESDTDLTHDQGLKIIQEENPCCPIVVCDAEGGGWEDPTKGILMLENLLTFSSTCKTQLIIFKSYLSRPDLVYAQISHIATYFHNIRIIRSHFSTINNTEVYLVGWSPRTGYPGVQCMSEVVNVRNDLVIRMRGSISGFPPFSKFLDLYIEPQRFNDAPIMECREYIQLISPPHWMESLIHQMKNYLLTIGKYTNIRTGERNAQGERIEETKILINFPSGIVHRWRNYLRPVAFSFQNPSNYFRNFLTRPLMAAMAYDMLIILGIPVKNPKSFITFSRLVQKGWLQIYPTLDGSWGFHLSWCQYSTKYNSKNVALRNLFPPSKVKELYSNLGILQYIKDDIKIEFHGRSCRSPTPYYIFDDQPEWWNKLGREVMSLSLTPVASKKEYSVDGVPYWTRQDWKIEYPPNIQLTSFLRTHWTNLISVRDLDDTITDLPPCFDYFGKQQIDLLRARRRCKDPTVSHPENLF
nr:RNA-dependent RNA polymerase [Drosophila busckii rhabdovirus]